MRAALAVVLLICVPAAAAGGAWPRGEGKAFVSLATLLSSGDFSSLQGLGADLRNYSSVYGEYGLGAEWTLGADAFYATGEDVDGFGAIVFARRTLFRLEGGHVFAADLGLGWLEESDADGTARIRSGLSWGKGFDSAWGGGWMSADGSLEYRLPRDEVIAKLDATLGLRPWPRWMTMVQIQSGHFGDDGFILKLAPSVAYELGEGRHLQLGLSIGLAGEDAVGVKLAHWWAF